MGIGTVVRAASLSLALLTVVGASQVAAQGGPANVQVDTVRTVEIAETQSLIARLVAMNESTVASRIPGIVATVHVDVGDRVETGDPLAELDTELLNIDLKSARSALVQAEAGLEVAKANSELADQVYQRTTRLRGSAAFSQGRFEDLAKELARARGELARSEALLAVARAGVARAQYQVENAKVLSPFHGVVLARDANPGAYVSVGAPVVRILDDRHLEIEADVPTEIVGALKPGTEVAAVLDDGTLGTATVRAAVPSESPSTRTRPVRFSVDVQGSDKPLAAGQTVTVNAPVGPPRAALSVAKDALVQQAGGWIVFVAEDGKAAPRAVTIGAAVEDRFEVSGALREGDIVVIRGNERLRPGQAIAFEPPAVASVETGSAQAPASGSVPN
ncbi:MAG: efflux RND transporter periplasmic adaptor subunit [Devosia sp.]